MIKVSQTPLSSWLKQATLNIDPALTHTHTQRCCSVSSSTVTQIEMLYPLKYVMDKKNRGVAARVSVCMSVYVCIWAQCISLVIGCESLEFCCHGNVISALLPGRRNTCLLSSWGTMNAHMHKHWLNDIQRANDSVHLFLSEETKDINTGLVALLDTQALSWSLY